MSADLLATFSNQLADAVAAATPSVVQVQGRRRPEPLRADGSGVLRSRADPKHRPALCHGRRRRELQDRDSDQ